MKISMKKRKIGYTYSSVSGRYPFRGEKTIEYESGLEKDFLILFESFDSVSDIVEQPFTIEYEKENGQIGRYTPDFLVEFRSHVIHRRFLSPDKSHLWPKPFLIEVKPREVLEKRFDEFRPKFKAAMAFARANDMIFHIYDDERIRGGERLKNAKHLRRFLLYHYDEYQEKRILDHIGTLGHCTIDVLITSLRELPEKRPEIRGHILSLLARGKLQCDLDLPLNDFTVVWRKEDNHE